MAKSLEADLLKLEQVQEPENASLVGRVMCVSSLRAIVASGHGH